MYALAIEKEAKDDLRKLGETDRAAAADISILLQEIEGDQSLLDLLSVHNHDDERLNISKLVYLQRKLINAWRMKVWSLEGKLWKYRVIYVFHASAKVYYVLAVVDRKFDYEKDDDFTKRIEAACKRLGIPELPRG